MLDRNIIDMVILYVGRGFHFYETPSTVPASMQNIDAHEHAAVLEGAFEDCRDFAVRGQLSRGADRLIESFVANLYRTRKHFAGEHANFTPLLDDRVYGTVRLSSEFWLVNLKVEAFQALAARNEL
jgi:hypothetical protein